MKSVGIAEGRAEFGDLCRRVATQRERVAVTDHGTPIAVIVSAAELADLEDMAAVARNRAHPEGYQDFDEFVKQLRAGEVS